MVTGAQKQLHQVSSQRTSTCNLGGVFQESRELRRTGNPRQHGHLRFDRGFDRGYGVVNFDDDYRAGNSSRAGVDLAV
jgi:hypothetical protein